MSHNVIMRLCVAFSVFWASMQRGGCVHFFVPACCALEAFSSPTSLLLRHQSAVFMRVVITYHVSSVRFSEETFPTKLRFKISQLSRFSSFTNKNSTFTAKKPLNFISNFSG